ncbi:MAG: S-adenosylmethionine:tRNA ribosyltransferase-isomerase [Bacteroidota bacterium]
MSFPNTLNLSQFDYHLPDYRIAKFPLQERDSSKLLVYDKGKITNSNFSKITDYLPKNAHLVFNDTKVIPARIFFENKNGALIEILLLKPYDSDYNHAFQSTSNSQWSCIIGNKKKWKKEEALSKTIEIDNSKTEVSVSFANYENNIVKFEWVNDQKSISFNELIEIFGQIPLPPYLNRNVEYSDIQNYQTVYSKNNGAVAAPTAGLHFTERIFKNLQKSNFTCQFVTLHVGAGTFLPIKEENVINHNMHNEQIIFSLNSIEELLDHVENIIPVGTTSMRALESLYWFGVKLHLINNNTDNNPIFFIEKLFPYQTLTELSPTKSLNLVVDFMKRNKLNQIVGETEILIIPSYQFRLCKALITNFHQPKSTLLLLISALIGEDWKRVYNFALENDYRFLSYGDSSLLIP